MPLTDAALRNAKPTDKPFKLGDSGGLYLYVTPVGGKLWRLKYRINGKEKLLSIGPYPLVGLREARAARDRAKRQLLEGIDPSEQKQAVRRREAADRTETYAALCTEYVAKLKREGRSDSTLGKIEWILGLVTPALGQRSMRELTSSDILAALRPIEARGKHETAQRLRSTIGSVFRYAIAAQKADRDPTLALQGALTQPVVKSRAAITEPKAFGALLRAVWGYDGTPEACSALRLMAFLSPRPGELRLAEWSELDLDASLWVIPAGRTKMRKPHRVPLPRAAVEIFNALQPVSGHGRFVFPSVRTQDRTISENTMNAALRRMGYTAEQMTAHGFRASFATLANESGLWHPDAIERALAHLEGSDVRRAYTRGEHWDERVRMAEWWAAECDRLRIQT